MAHDAVSPEVMRQRALVSAKNIEVTKHYAEFMACYVLLFILFYFFFWIAKISIKRFPTATSIVSSPSRLARRVTLLNVPFYPSMGHALTILAYWAVIAVFSLTYRPPPPVNGVKSWFPKRLGWMAIMNMTATVVLSIKNTPLSYLTGFSHERLNVLHRAAGFTTVVCFILHMALYCWIMVINHKKTSLTTEEQIHGWVAGVCMIIMALFGIRPIRTRFYEAFLKVHTVGYILVLINTALHKPALTRRVAWLLVFAGASFVSSRLIRFGKLVYNSWGNSATLIAQDGATKVILSKKIAAKPGDHFFISVPAVRAFESHPFSVSDTQVTQFRCRKRDGFTAALHKYALENPGKKVKILVEGPFGATPNFDSFDRILLIAGGVGATFVFSVALDIVRRPQWDSGKVVKMVWLIRSESHSDWFHHELIEIRRSKRIDLTIFITRPNPAASSTPNPESARSLSHIIPPPSPSLSASSHDHEKQMAEKRLSIHSTTSKRVSVHETVLEHVIDAVYHAQHAVHEKMHEHDLERDLERDLEKHIDNGAALEFTTSPSADSSQVELKPHEEGKPDLKLLIKDMVRSAGRSDRVVVSSCGPPMLMEEVRNTVAGLIPLSGPSVTLQNEQFGW